MNTTSPTVAPRHPRQPELFSAVAKGADQAYRYGRIRVEQGENCDGRFAELHPEYPIFLAFGRSGSLELWFKGTVRSSGFRAPATRVVRKILTIARSGSSAIEEDPGLFNPLDSSSWKIQLFSGRVERSSLKSYSTLSCWPSSRREEGGGSEGPNNLESADQTELTVSIMEILLDLLFSLDFREDFSEEFKSCLEQLVEGDQFLRLVRAKARYYWQRENLADRWLNLAKDTRRKERLYFRYELLLKAELSYTKALLSMSASALFVPSIGWFFDQESEVRSIAALDLEHKPFAGMSASHQQVFELGLIIQAWEDLAITPLDRRRHRARTLATWFLRRYDLDAAFWCIFETWKWPMRTYAKCSSLLTSLGAPKNAKELEPAHRNAPCQRDFQDIGLLPHFLGAALAVLFTDWPSMLGFGADWDWLLIMTAVFVGFLPVTVLVCWQHLGGGRRPNIVRIPFSLISNSILAIAIFGIQFFLLGDIGILAQYSGPVFALLSTFLGPAVAAILVGTLVAFGILRPAGAIGNRASEAAIFLARLTLPRVVFATAAAWMVTASFSELWQSAVLSTGQDVLFSFFYFLAHNVSVCGN